MFTFVCTGVHAHVRACVWSEDNSGEPVLFYHGTQGSTFGGQACMASSLAGLAISLVCILVLCTEIPPYSIELFALEGN